MPTFLPKSIRRAALGAAAAAVAMGAAQGCTDLTETPRDALTPTTAFKTDEELLAGTAAVYAQLRQTMWANYNLSEITTDEQIVPTRGSDWFDNGRWLEIYRHTWTANSGSALDDMNRQWNDMFAGVARSNRMIDIVQASNSEQKAPILAELRTLRAWYYYLLMDFFGGVPVVTTAETQPTARASRDSVFKFIEAELRAARPDLPNKADVEYGRVNKHVADAILANMYLNAPVFQGAVTAGGVQRAAPRYQEAIAAADAVINSGQYQLEPDYRLNFSLNNETSRENIFVIVNSTVLGLGMSIPQRSLHYNSFRGGAWNGFAAVAETYAAFDPADTRRASFFAVGQQRSFTTGAEINDRAGAKLVFTETIADPTKANENEGPRLIKFPPSPSPSDGDSHPNDYPFFRLAEMYMIKAEALNELGRTAEAINLVNQLRARAFATPKPLSPAMSQAEARQAILNERLFEFVGEAKRRQDLIRMGGLPGVAPRFSFTGARSFKQPSEPFRVLFPIPQTQLQTNPLLQQNPGY
jgi:hypothetical protein